jgi:Na+-transporting NADH:ubiquinone oxidoreductase subunit C
MLKGEGNPAESLDDHHVDGLAGATITARGLNNMLYNYLEYYQNYLKKVSS